MRNNPPVTRRIRLFVALVILVPPVVASPAPAGAPPESPVPSASPAGQVFGRGVGDAKLVPIAELVSNPAAYVGRTIRVEGLVADVCPRAGCWLDLAGGEAGAVVRIKVDDGAIVFPKEAKGKQAAVEGVFTRIDLTPAESLALAKHLAEEKGETFDQAKPGEMATVTYQLKGTGAVIR